MKYMVYKNLSDMGTFEIIEDVFARYKSGNNKITYNQTSLLMKKK